MFEWRQSPQATSYKDLTAGIRRHGLRLLNSDSSLVFLNEFPVSLVNSGEENVEDTLRYRDTLC